MSHVDTQQHSQLAVMLNGCFIDADAAIAINDRGLMYGDGVFESLRYVNEACFLQAYHLSRLARGLQALAIELHVDYVAAQLQRYVDHLPSSSEYIVKVLVTRGLSARGYAMPVTEKAAPTIVISASEAAPVPAQYYRDGVAVRLCQTRMGRNPTLAGIKHLNRLEQVLARAEWNDAAIFEGLVCDSEGLLIEATAANLFLLRAGTLITPDLSQCGVAGTMRDYLLEKLLPGLNLSCQVRSVTVHDLYQADEVLLVSSRLGVMPVSCCAQQFWPVGPVGEAIRQALENATKPVRP